MVDFGFERSLVLCLLLNAAVFFSCWWVAWRRWTTSRAQAMLDAALLGYAVQYLSVGLAGLLGHLNFGWVSSIAIGIAAGLVAWGWKKEQPAQPARLPIWDRLIALGAGLFVLGFLLAYAHEQEFLPVISNDAMTYHFPAAVQWIQQGRIDYFQTWFFNPANTYSPMAGSTFIAWLLLPFGNDLLARFVEVPALLCVGLAIYRLCRQLRVSVAIAALIAGAAVLSRPIFTPCMMGKDDLFVVFFFLCAVIAMSPERSTGRFGGLRFGAALGLLMATKYTAILAIPMLLLAIDGPRWKVRRWIVTAAATIVLAGPWYLHNWISTGNPIFPIALPHVFRGLFTTATSAAFHPWRNASSVIVGGQYGVPISLAIVMGCSVVACVVFEKKQLRDPLLRLCIWGPFIGIGLFYLRSPFPEVRFLLPVFSLLFVCCAVAIDRCCQRTALALAIAGAIFLLSLSTVFSESSLTAQFAAIGLLLCAIGLGAYLWTGYRKIRIAIVTAAFTFAALRFVFIHWHAYCQDYLSNPFEKDSAYDQVYPRLNQLWSWVDQHVPADSTVACSNLYFTYPLQGPALRRQVFYAPTRAGVTSIADLPWLGNRLAGEAIVPAAVTATVASPDRSAWLKNLEQLKCDYLIIGHGGVVRTPPEESVAASLPDKFERVFSGPAGTVYRIRR